MSSKLSKNVKSSNMSRVVLYRFSGYLTSPSSQVVVKYRVCDHESSGFAAEIAARSESIPFLPISLFVLIRLYPGFHFFNFLIPVGIPVSEYAKSVPYRGH